jgi:hypothetical protein
MRRALFVLLALGLLSGCKGEEKVSPAMDKLGRATGPVAKSKRAEKPPGHPPGQADEHAPGQGGAGIVHTGEVLETIDASRYTYVRLQLRSGEDLWAAIPRAKLAVGEPVAIVQSLVMKDFESKTLKRTFPSVVFGVLKEKAK